MKKYLSLIILMILIIPSVVFAQCADLSSSEPAAFKLCTAISDVGNILGVAGIAIAIVMVMVGAIKYITAGDSEDKAKSGRQTIINGLIGAAIVGVAYELVSMVKEFIVSKFS